MLLLLLLRFLSPLPPTLSQGEDAVSWHWVFDIDNAKNVYIRKDDIYNEVE